MVITWTNGYNM